MIVKAFLAILGFVADFIFSLIPDLPLLPSFVGQALSFMQQIMVSGAGIIRWLVTDSVYLACIDFIVLLYTWKIFLTIFNIVKKFILMRGSD